MDRKDRIVATAENIQAALAFVTETHTGRFLGVTRAKIRWRALLQPM
jgi:hypothetical protein